MKNLTLLIIGTLALGFAGLACKNPLASYTKQYACEMPGEPEPATAEEYLKRAYKHGEQNNYTSDPGGCALGACAEAIRLDPKNADAYYCRAQVHHSAREREKALADFDEAVRLKPDFALAYIGRGTVNGELQRYDQAIADMTKGIELLGADAGYFHYSRRGEFNYQADKYEDAVKDFTKAIELRPEDKYTYSDRARVYEKMGKTDLAEADKKKVAEIETGANTTDNNQQEDAPTGSSPTISGGVLNDKAKTLPTPVYPPAARAVRASGAVNVQITVNEKGEVTSANGVSGHPLLRAAAVQAAMKTTFEPRIVNGKPVKVSGVLVFDFKP